MGMVREGEQGPLAQKIIDELSEGPKTLKQLSVAVYGQDDDLGRLNVQQLIGTLRRRKRMRIERDSIYKLKGK